MLLVWELRIGCVQLQLLGSTGRITFACAWCRIIVSWILSSGAKAKASSSSQAMQASWQHVGAWSRIFVVVVGVGLLFSLSLSLFFFLILVLLSWS